MVDTVRTVNLADIVVDPDIQPRVGGLDAAHIRSLEETPDAWPPVTVVKYGSKLLLVDGNHRFASAQNLGLLSIAANVVELSDNEDPYALAFRLNLGHGRPLTLADRRAFAEHVLRTQPELSDRAIGEMTSLSGNTVTALRRELEADAQIEHPSERIGRGGYVYRDTTRELGEMPEESLGERAGNLATRMLSGPERLRQRTITSYLRRVTTAISDKASLPDWTDPREAIAACTAVLGVEKASEQGVNLGSGAASLLEVALGLGYNPDADDV
jgi:hypothetical protein